MPGVEGELLKQVKGLMITQQQMLNSLREEIRGKNNWPYRNQSSNYRVPFKQNQNISRPTSNRAPQKSPGRNLRTTDGQVICNKCHQVGHIVRLCPNLSGPMAKQNIDALPELVDVNVMPSAQLSSHMATVSGCIEGRNATFILDSGSGIRVMSSQVIAKIPALSAKGLVTCPSMTVRSVTGQDLKVIGTINANLEICGRTITYTVYVADEFYFDCLLGTDILSALGTVIDFATKMISFREKTTPFSTAPPPAPCIVRVKETVVIPPRSEICLLLKTGFPGMVEPTLFNKKGLSKLQVARTARLPEKGILSVRVLNLASEPETMYKKY